MIAAALLLLAAGQPVPEPPPGTIGLPHVTRYDAAGGALLFSADEPSVTIEGGAGTAQAAVRAGLPPLLCDHPALAALSVTLADPRALIEAAASSLAHDPRWDRRLGRARRGDTHRLIARVIEAGPLQALASAFAASGWSLRVETAARITLTRHDGALVPDGIATLVFHATRNSPPQPCAREEMPR